MTIAALVLASGQSKRYGQDDKLLVDLKGQALLAYCLDATKNTDFDGYYVVCPDPDPRADLARARGFSIIKNPAPEKGQGASLALGIKTLIDLGYDGVCVVLGDMPFITPSYLNALKKEARDKDIVFSRVDTKDMPPAIFKDEALKVLTTLSGDHGARNLDLSSWSVGYKDLPRGMAFDFDTPDDFH